MKFLTLLLSSFLDVAILSLLCFPALVQCLEHGNCVGTKSCRPRCISFQVDRAAADCHPSGQFDFHPSPWNVTNLRASPCGSTLDMLPADLSLRIFEEGYTGQRDSVYFDLDAHQDSFVFCSIYECPNNECQFREQIGTKITIEFFPQQPFQGDNHDQRIMTIELFLTVDFPSPELSSASRFGPISVNWMDDPASCRDDSPVPDFFFPTMMLVEGDDAVRGAFCEEDDGLVPHTPIGESQLSSLQTFFDSTHMDSPLSRPLHNWFVDNVYCNFTGIVCDSEGYVTFLDLNETGLTGTLPEVFDSFPKLLRFRVYNNGLEGTIPASIVALQELRQINLGLNRFDDTIPEFLGKIPMLRRILLQGNNLMGMLPESWCDLTGLRSIDVAENPLVVGEIPACIGSLSELQVFRIRDASLTGVIPEGLCDGRVIDGLEPNEFGCDGVACPSGSIQSLMGRQVNEGTPCIDCAQPSNVLGSTSCRWVETQPPTPVTTDHPTPKPTPSTTSAPVAVSAEPTNNEIPTVSPSATLTMIPTTSRPSMFVDPFPQPTLLTTAEPTSLPSAASNIASVGKEIKGGSQKSPARFVIPIVVAVLLGVLLVAALVWGRQRRTPPASPLAAQEDIFLMDDDGDSESSNRLHITAADISVEEKEDGVHARFADVVDFGTEDHRAIATFPTDEESFANNRLAGSQSAELESLQEASLDEISDLDTDDALQAATTSSLESDSRISGPSLYPAESSTIATASVYQTSVAASPGLQPMSSPSRSVKRTPSPYPWRSGPYRKSFQLYPVHSSSTVDTSRSGSRGLSQTSSKTARLGIDSSFSLASGQSSMPVMTLSQFLTPRKSVIGESSIEPSELVSESISDTPGIDSIDSLLDSSPDTVMGIHASLLRGLGQWNSSAGSSHYHPRSAASSPKEIGTVQEEDKHSFSLECDSLSTASISLSPH